MTVADKWTPAKPGGYSYAGEAILERKTYRSKGIAEMQRKRKLAAGFECTPVSPTHPGWRTATDYAFFIAYPEQ